MRISGLAAVAVLGSSLVVALGQGPEMGGLPEQVAPSAQSGPPVGGPARERPAVAPMNRPDPNSAAQVGRNALWKYLDDIADKDTAARRAEIAKITTKGQAVLRQQEVRTKVLALMGGSFAKTPLNAKVVGSTQLDGFRIEKVVYESQPKFYVTALLYVPDPVTNATAGTKGGPQGLKPDSVLSVNGTPEGVPLTKASDGGGAAVSLTKAAGGGGAAVSLAKAASGGGKWPAIVMAPGHSASGKAGDFAMASAFARNGFAVLSYDPIGQGERLQYLDPKTATTVVTGSPYPGQSFATRATGEHGEAGLQPTLIGDAVGRYFAWDGVRAVDYLISRPEVDAEKIGAFGCSGGGAMTALLSAADKRVKATATACYFTSFDTLLPSIGAQDAEQSVPGFIASGFDFPDWIELAAPRAYAMVGTVSDMFPWAGFLKTAQEARRFYSLFDATAEGVGSCQLQVAGCPLTTPTGPTLNPDTLNEIPATSPFQVLAGIGGHGNLKPITAQIVGFFLVHLAGKTADEYVGAAGAAEKTNAGVPPLASGSVGMTTRGGVAAPAGALQVTPTGQVATSYPDAATVFSLNLERAKGKIPEFASPQTLMQVQTDVRMVTRAEAAPGQFKTDLGNGGGSLQFGTTIRQGLYFESEPGIGMGVDLVTQTASGRHPAVLIVSDVLPWDSKQATTSTSSEVETLADAGNVVLAFPPRPSPAGGEEVKSPILGPFYLTELRAELVGKTLLGMRVDDVIRAVDYLASRPDVDPHNITVVASGHMGLVALHAAVLDSRIKHVTVDHVLESYASLLRAPMPLDAPQDVLPGVLLKYDVPDLVRVLGGRVTATDWLPGTANLGWKP